MTSPTAERKPRLLVLASTYPRWKDDTEPGFVHELSRRLTSTFDVVVVTPHAKGALATEFMDAVRVHRYRYAPAALETLVNDGGIVANIRRSKWKLLLLPGFVLGLLWTAWRLVRTWNVDVVHAHWLIPQGLVAAALCSLPGPKVPYVVTSHGADLYALRGHWFDLLKRFVAARAAEVTIVSSSMREELARIGARSEQAQVMPMGVDLLHRFTPDESSRQADEILFVGRFVEKKGLRVLLQAMPRILSRRPAARLFIAGFGPEETRLRREVEDLGLAATVTFLGAVPQADLPRIYRRAAVFVSPFLQARSGDREGLGLVTVEAIACGCPVVVGDVPAVRDVLSSPEDASKRVPTGDVAALADAVLWVLEHPEKAREEAVFCRERVLARFDWNDIASAYSEILLKVLPPSGLGGKAESQP